MITIKQIHSARSYMRVHLSANDYYSQNEQVIGQWYGKAAQMLGIEGQEVNTRVYEALRTNRHPQTGEKLRPRSARVAYHDTVVSAPKSVSIVAMVGGDERLVDAYDRCALKAFGHLESFAGIRFRQGMAVNSERIQRTGNAVAAIFRHDTSRLLDPQLHSHLVFGNLSWDEASKRWLALQPKEMMEQSSEWIRGKFYQDLERECRTLGYSTERDGEAFRITEIPRSIEHAFSQRAIQRNRFIERYRKVFGQEPDKKRVEHFIKDQKDAATRRFVAEYREHFRGDPRKEEVESFVQDWRSKKMAQSTREKVQALQESRITAEQAQKIRNAVNRAQSHCEENAQSISAPSKKEELVQVEAQSQRNGLKQTQVTESLNRSPSQVQENRRIHHPMRNMGRLKKAKMGRELTTILNAHPTRLMARRIQQLARKKQHGSQRRTY